MHRRALLSAVGGGVAALSGCLGAGDDDARDGGSPTASPTETYPAVSVGDVAVTPEYVALNTPDSIATYGDRGGQFVFAKVATGDAPGPRRAEFALAAGGEIYAPADELRSYGRLTAYHPAYEPGEGGWLPVPVPQPLAGSEPRLTWPGGEHALAEAAVTRLGRPPTSFAVREFAAPDAIELGESATVTLVVENVGEAAGTFVAALNRVGPWVAHAPVEAISLELDPGETETWEYTHGTSTRRDADSGTREMTFHLDWRGGERSATTEVTVP